MGLREETAKPETVIAACTSCNGVRGDAEHWQSLDEFLHLRYGLTIQRCLCPECLKRFYPELSKSSGQVQ
jgi:hypothetical protein